VALAAAAAASPSSAGKHLSRLPHSLVAQYYTVNTLHVILTKVYKRERERENEVLWRRSLTSRLKSRDQSSSLAISNSGTLDSSRELDVEGAKRMSGFLPPRPNSFFKRTSLIRKRVPEWPFKEFCSLSYFVYILSSLDIFFTIYLIKLMSFAWRLNYEPITNYFLLLINFIIPIIYWILRFINKYYKCFTHKHINCCILFYTHITLLLS